jgi:tetratricopeptide (TPR) repeat protein
MFKKIVIISIVLAVIGVAALPLLTSKVAENAFDNPLDPESPVKVREAMLMRIRLQRYQQARQLAEKAVIYFPESREMPYFMYNAAKCAEQEREPEVAIFWYKKFLKRYPKHTWATQAKNSLNKLEGIYGDFEK